jgi:hypothetical protein
MQRGRIKKNQCNLTSVGLDFIGNQGFASVVVFFDRAVAFWSGNQALAAEGRVPIFAGDSVCNGKLCWACACYATAAIDRMPLSTFYRARQIRLIKSLDALFDFHAEECPCPLMGFVEPPSLGCGAVVSRLLRDEE